MLRAEQKTLTCLYGSIFGYIYCCKFVSYLWLGKSKYFDATRSPQSDASDWAWHGTKIHLGIFFSFSLVQFQYIDLIKNRHNSKKRQCFIDGNIE